MKGCKGCEEDIHQSNGGEVRDEQKEFNVRVWASEWVN